MEKQTTVERNNPTQPQEGVLSVVIVGAGFSGLGMAIQLKKAGISSFVILEAAGEVGGTWRDNTYPGCACDVPSHLYSFSFELWPDWSKNYSDQEEILAYLKHCVGKYELAPYLRFGVRVSAMRFDESEGLWHVTAANGDRYIARTVVGATGPFGKPSMPSIPGHESFAGPSFHSARWDHSVSLRGKTVAVVGTGASAIQLVPSIANKVDRLLLFQRTPAWVLPRRERTFSRRTRSLFRRLPWFQRLYRHWIYLRMESRAFAFVSRPGVLRFLSKVGRRYIRKSIADEALREALTPDYTMGCKRVLISDDYYAALNRDNVAVITEGIQAIDETGLLTADGRHHDVDVIVYATGFDVYDFLGPIEVKGLGGRDLKAQWSEAAETFYGMTVSGFPNFFVLLGPNTGLGHNSVVFMIESQVRFVFDCIQQLERRNLKYIDVRPEVQRRFFAGVQERMKHTVWLSGGCHSWYLNERGENYTLWPGTTVEYWRKTARLHPSDFRLVPWGDDA